VFVPHPAIELSLEYFLGLLNSRVMWLWFQHNAKRRGVGLEINGNVLRRAPIVHLNLNAAQDQEYHEKMIQLVRSMLHLFTNLQSATGHAATAIRRQIDATDRRIDTLVYALYGLTDEEIAVVEAATQ
jgi:hypothetical protein